MATKGRLATILIALALFGCKGPLQTSAANAAEGLSGASAGNGATTASASGGSPHKEYVTDPTLNNMNAFDVTIPAKWHFQGTLFQGGNCSSLPYGVWRATSPDGLSMAERMPALGWVWGTGPMIGFMPKNDCLPLKGPMSAQEFLKFLAATMKVEYVSDEPVPAELNAKALKEVQDAAAIYAPQYAARNQQAPKNTRELARANVRYKNGTFTMKGRLDVLVDCSETISPGMPGLSNWSPGHPVHATTGPPSTVDKCTAGVRYITAPESQFAGVIRQWEMPGMGGHSEDAWQQAWVQRSTAQTQQAINQMWADSRERMQAQQQQFNHDQAVRQQMHEDFMATMQRGTDISMARTQQNMNARSTAASDWVDYALDRRTVADPNTGQITKVSSSYNNTWVDSTGRTSYQTNDLNANPNGVLPGNWTKQTVVHGNGTQ
jgi:hypothetical protein